MSTFTFHSSDNVGHYTNVMNKNPQVYLFNDSMCLDDVKLKFYDVVVTVNADFCVFGLTVVCFHDSHSSFYMITTRRLGFENDMVQYRVELNSSSSLSRVRVRARVELELESS